METVITLFVGIFLGYVAIGVLFSVYFFLKGARQLDALIADSSWKVRLLLIPGAIGLWPVLLIKLLRNKKVRS